MRLSSLTNVQKDAIRTWLAANTAGMSDGDAAKAASAVASPSYLVWATSVRRDAVQGYAAFDWTRVDNLSVGKARIWDWMFNSADTIPAYKGNYRAGINAVWVGTQADLDVRAAVNAACQRSVTNMEKLFVTQTVDGPAQNGTRGTVTNADQIGVSSIDGLFLEGGITEADVVNLRNS